MANKYRIYAWVVLGMAVVMCSAAFAQVAPPAMDSAESRLLDETAKMIEHPNLRPIRDNCTEHYGSRRANWGDQNSYYWLNPAETIYTLLRALPHMPETPYPNDMSKTWREKLREYIQWEWNYAPPTTKTHRGWGGTSRQYALAPSELEAELSSLYPQGPSTTSWPGWAANANPFNFYAAWKYAEEFGGAQAILDSIRSKVAAVPTYTIFDDPVYGIALTADDLPHVLNCYIAGYYGVLGLQDLAGEARNATWEGWLADALARRVAQLSVTPNPLVVIPPEAGGFKYLVPELGDYLQDNALAALMTYVDYYGQNVAPMWFIARADEVSRIKTGTKYAEGSTTHYYEYWSLFQAKALAVKEGRAQLEKYLDAPAVLYGDLFFIQNLVSTIEAGDVAAGPVANFSASIDYLVVDFDGSSSIGGDAPIVSYDWDFGDGNSASGVTCSHTYAAEGAYTVVLTVTDANTNIDIAQQMLNLSGPDISDIGDLNGDGDVNFPDFAILANYWLGDEPTVDIIYDHTINAKDLAVIASNWMSGVTVPHQEPTAHYPFDGNANDVSPFGNNGTLLGNPTFTADRHGNPSSALHFDGDGDSVNCGNFNPSQETGLLTAAFWIYSEGSASDQHIIAKRTSWAADMMWQTALKAATGNSLQISTGNSPIGTSVVDFAVVPLNTWTHVAITYDGTNATCYINGANPVSGAFSMGLGTTSTLSIGVAYQGGGTTTTFFKGTLDDVRMYDRVLTQAEIQTLATP